MPQFRPRDEGIIGRTLAAGVVPEPGERKHREAAGPE
jgi:hypothetical protein